MAKIYSKKTLVNDTMKPKKETDEGGISISYSPIVRLSAVEVIFFKPYKVYKVI